MKKITSLAQFNAKHFNEDSSEYIQLEAKIINSFFKRLIEHGYTLNHVWDYEDRHIITDNDRFQALDCIFAVDQSTISITAPNGEKFALFILLGEGETLPFYDNSIQSEHTENFIDDCFAKSVKTHSIKYYENYHA